ncbi:MAG TPA: large conductance mechanosensitive channel protein MscL [Acidisphaera sp.]|nr:large conductance mechanosensitive channel protein MscL [Acidisphaera sp.]
MPTMVERVRTPRWVSDFKSFIARGSVVDLAVGVIIGAAFTTIVASLVKDIINPIIGVFTGGVDFSNVFVALNGQHYATLADAQKAGAPTINIGLFINAVINFLIVAFVIFWVVRALSRLMPKPEPKPAGPPADVVLLTEIRDILRARAPEPAPPA